MIRVPGWGVVAAVGLILAGCADGPPHRPLHDAESALGTTDNTTIRFHTSVYFPTAVSLTFPGYVIGVDKSPVRSVAQSPEHIPLYEIDDKDIGKGINRKARRLKSSPKTFYIAHLHEYKGQHYGKGNCTWYNLYYQLSKRLNAPRNPDAKGADKSDDISPFESFLPWCGTEKSGTEKSGTEKKRSWDDEPPPFRDGSPSVKEELQTWKDYFRAYQANERPRLNVLEEDPFMSGWDALDILKREVKARVKAEKTTHIVVVVMGWNTVQTEAYRNFNSIMTNIQRHASDDFKPLFIGVTWPSSWESGWAEPLVKLTSYPVKANDADEVGLSWLGALFRDALNEVSDEAPNPKVVAIGHSFGARATSTAVCVGPAIDRNGDVEGREATPAKVDLFIGLQPAFSLNRFFPNSGSEDIAFPNMCNNGMVALTTSENDQAVKSHPFAPMVGDYRQYKEQCGKDGSPFRCVVARPDGSLESPPPEDARLIYVNANALIRYNNIGTGGGAHSDIYRIETGRFIWEMIKLESERNPPALVGDGKQVSQR